MQPLAGAAPRADDDDVESLVPRDAAAADVGRVAADDDEDVALSRSLEVQVNLGNEDVVGLQ